MELSATQVGVNNLLRAVTKVREYLQIRGYESEGSEIERAVVAIKTLLDDEVILTSESEDCLRVLNEVIYQAEDVFDGLLVFHLQKPHVKLSQKVRTFFAGSSLSRQLKTVQKKLKDVSDALSKHRSLNVGNQSMSIKRREATSSYSYATNVIGRDSDVSNILDMMLPSKDDVRDTSFVSIVGIGGLGKTTLAQLVYNNDWVAAAFPLRIWVCVGDDFNLESICARIVEAGTGMLGETPFAKLEKVRFLLVLDDVWCEDREEITKLQNLLMRGRNGSCVLSTTRSAISAGLMAGSDHVYYLKGLSEEDSWRLFKMTAFDREEQESQLVDIGRKICARCCNVPLALRVVGSLLYDQNVHKWLAILTAFDNSFHSSDGIFNTLKLSYDNLESPLKCCFRLCALFPKDDRIPKELLISLWMAQGYVEPSPVTGDCLEDVAEGYFNTLLQRCFFLDVERDDYGDVVSCRIHDLLHDLAQHIAGKEIVAVESLASLSAEVRHVFHVGKENMQASLSQMSLRTYLQTDFRGHVPVSTLVTNCMLLRALSLHDLDDRTLPESIGKLIHLRFLDLSRNKFLETLPKSLTKLCHLQTLNLRDCFSLINLPSDLSKLVLLRRLDISGCKKLTCMPSNMNNLTHLRMLTLFVLNEGDSSGKLGDLNALHNLKGCIEILIPANYIIPEENENEREVLRKIAHLKAFCIHFRESGDANMQSAVLEKLQPHQNLKGFTLKGYLGLAPHWAASIENLVKLELISCKGLICLPFISKLIFLKSLILDDLVNLEYMEDASTVNVSPGSNDPELFPRLEYLNISRLFKFENWWRRVDFLDKDHVDSFKIKSTRLSFPRLFHLNIQRCPELTSFPLCPQVKELYLTELNANLSIFDLCPNRHLNLKELIIDDIDYLRSKSVIKRSISLESLTIKGRSMQSGHVAGESDHSTTSEERLDGNIKDDSEDDEPWKLFQESLRTLELDSMEMMMNLPKGMQHLKVLQHLTISFCSNLKAIPEWISCLASLETLCIRFCSSLKVFPESMRKLTSLRHLEIRGQTYLQKRCEAIHGEDWPKIQHIPSLTFH